ncbi:MAG: Zn-ribbon domain-containing OB-fold protein [Smithella sp.]|nr:Zn-ribbon domain-containing OB-fold protein [Smithellaceae bacterium]NLA42308.1 Zn-ribbon domain-containing OB-fold protein [Smithella sp.]
MSDQFQGIEPMVYQSKINVPYSWWAGDTASKFFIKLRDEKKIMGTKCPSCNKVFLPPRKVCPSCFIENTEWVSLSGEGTVLSFTVARRQFAAIPQDKKIPVIWGLIKLDGADTALLHYLDEVRPESVEIGMRVKAVFSDTRKGAIHDISHFKPVK